MVHTLKSLTPARRFGAISIYGMVQLGNKDLHISSIQPQYGPFCSHIYI